MDKDTKRKIYEELDMIAKLRARAREAEELWLFDLAKGCLEDMERRKHLVQSLAGQ